jgi:hypothetical protein
MQDVLAEKVLVGDMDTAYKGFGSGEPVSLLRKVVM